MQDKINRGDYPKEYKNLVDDAFGSPIVSDIIIYSALISGVILELFLLTVFSKYVLLVSIIAFAQAVLIYGSFIEPRRIKIFRKKILIKKNQNPATTLRAILVSDIHAGPHKKEKFVRKVVSKINQLNPDLVLIAGDHVFDKAEEIKYLKPLKNIRSKFGSFATLGNHDYDLLRIGKLDFVPIKESNKDEIIAEKLENWGIRVLRNEIEYLDINGGNLQIVGLDDTWGKRNNYDKIFLEVTQEMPTIILQHNPDIITDKRSRNADLILSGHTHSGQIRLPFIGVIKEIPTKIENKYDHGLFQLDKTTQLFITKGVGEVGTRARLFSRPEIVLLDIVF